MSMIYCHDCDKNIDTDFHAEHFDDKEKCVVEEVEEKAEKVIKNHPEIDWSKDLTESIERREQEAYKRGYIQGQFDKDMDLLNNKK